MPLRTPSIGNENTLQPPVPLWRFQLQAEAHRQASGRLAEGHAIDRPQGTALSRGQLRITDADGMRITCFATNTPDRPIDELELRHRLRARAEDRIRAALATGLRNLPLRRTAQNWIWLEIVQIALDLLAWMPMLALTGKARLWEARRLRFRLFSAAAQLVTTSRCRILRLAQNWPWISQITAALERLALLPNPG